MALFVRGEVTGSLQNRNMKIGGFQKFSLIDYPGKICAIIFTQGCNYRCGYCHNPELVEPKLFSPLIPEEEIFSFLEKRKGKLEAVEITGGEPTLQPDLFEVLRKIKAMGYLTKLDSNGSNPEVVQKAVGLNLVDYLAMDIKAPLGKYRSVINSNIDLNKITRSIKLIMNSGLDYEFRTTVVKSQLKKDDILKIGEMIRGAKLYILQRFTPAKTLDPRFLKEETYSEEEFENFKESLKGYITKCIIR